MGVDIKCYRAVIGAFHIVTHRFLNLPKPFIRLLFHIYCAIAALALLFLTRSFVKNDEFAFYRLILLLICMDIQPNPGPYNSEITTLDIFYLNTRSVRNKLERIYDIADNYHIICFSETHLDDNVDNSSLILEGFDEPIRKDRTHNGGVLWCTCPTFYDTDVE